LPGWHLRSEPTRVNPVAALLEEAPLEPTRWARYSLPACLGTLAGGAALVGWGLAGRGGAGAVGGGALALFIGVALLSPRFVPPLGYAVGATVAWRGVTGKMARENARRQPGRTAVTASALMVGLALVTFVSIVASSTQATVKQVLDDDLAGNMVVEPSSSGGGPGLPSALAPALGRVPGVATVAAVTFSEAKVAGLRGTQTVTGIDGAALARLYRVKWVVGTASVMAHLGGGAAIVTRSFASAHHLVAGQRLSLLTPSGRHMVAVVRGVVSDQAGLLDDITLSRWVVEGQFSQPTDAVDFVGYARGATASSVKLAVDRLLASRFPQAQAWTVAEFRRHQADQVGSLLARIYVLLALAVVVSLFGLVNTLVLSIYERSRELGVLRAVGASRRQVRQLVRYESVVTSLIGAASGLAVGALFGVVMVLSVGGSTAVLSVPLPTLGAMVMVAAAAGAAAAALPARRASRLDILAAVASE
jgi:putative ABC transport system permease protein